MNTIQYEAKYDLNKDGIIDQKDVDIFLKYMGTAVTHNNLMSSESDFNKDGYIDEIDYSALIAHNGATAPVLSTSTSMLPILLIGGIIIAIFIMRKSNGRK